MFLGHSLGVSQGLANRGRDDLTLYFMYWRDSRIMFSAFNRQFHLHTRSDQMLEMSGPADHDQPI